MSFKDAIHYGLLIVIGSLLLAFGNIGQATTRDTKSFYAGGLLGYGSTDWNQLSCNACNPDDFVLLSVPQNATDKGIAWGLFVGFQINPQFTFEATYTRFADSILNFAPGNLYIIDPVNGTSLTTLISHTASYSLVGKFFGILKESNYYAH